MYLYITQAQLTKSTILVLKTFHKANKEPSLVQYTDQNELLKDNFLFNECY